jgi:hypothetical protein
MQWVPGAVASEAKRPWFEIDIFIWYRPEEHMEVYHFHNLLGYGNTNLENYIINFGKIKCFRRRYFGRNTLNGIRLRIRNRNFCLMFGYENYDKGKMSCWIAG